MTLAMMIFVTGVAACTVTIALLLLARLGPEPHGAMLKRGPKVALLFDGSDLEDQTQAAQTALALPKEDTDWADLQRRLSHRFANLPQRLEVLAEGPHHFAARTGDAMLTLDRLGSRTTLTLEEAEAEVLSARNAQLEAECATLQRALDSSPHPIWQADPSGHVTWSNAAYVALQEEVGMEPESTEPVFKPESDNVPGAQRHRVQVKRQADGTALWFDLVQQQRDGVTIGHAMDIETVIRAEVAQRNFVQTLAKTFAQLSIGLAIFDRNGKLALFNPALVDLTVLPAEFLSARPDLSTFFDRLRDNRMMPEPKSYTSWREQIAGLIAAAEDGRYQETWTLESGQTYRVSGRPHPDQAIAFLIEDISAEMSLTRNFRAELEQGQSLVDSLADPIAVFTNTGVLSLSNRAYCTLFGVDPDSSFADVTVIDALRDWQTIGAPSPVWGEVRDYVLDPQERTAWDAEVPLQDGTRWAVFLEPLARGATSMRLTPKPVRGDNTLEKNDQA